MSQREHTPYHERSLDQQALDALLRIEEVLGRILATQQTLVDALPPKALVASVTEAISAPKGKRK